MYNNNKYNVFYQMLLSGSFKLSRLNLPFFTLDCIPKILIMHLIIILHETSHTLRTNNSYIVLLDNIIV